MADPNTFARRIGRIARQVSERADNIVQRASLAALAAVVTATPVDTGRARSNWLVALDLTPSETIETRGRDPGPTIAAGAATIAQYDGGVNHAVHITNNLPYIARLDEGYSAQAPAGYVDQAIAVAVASVRGARLL